MTSRTAQRHPAPPAHRPAGVTAGAAADDGATSLEKGLAVLERLSRAQEGAGVSELARDLGLPKSTVARLLMILSGRGYVWRDAPAMASSGAGDPGGPGGAGGGSRPRYRLGPRALELTANALDELLVVGAARAHLYDLAGRTGRVACLGVLWGGVAVVVDLVEPPAATPAVLAPQPLAVGRGTWFYVSSIGKAILAYRPADDLDHLLRTYGPLVARTRRTITSPAALRQHLAEVREQGWAVNDGESTVAGTSVAAPVFSHSGAVVAAVAAAETHRPGEAVPADAVAAVVEAGRRISFGLGAHPRAFR
jgi:DNA-binding IclR family transcriptional regulator